MLERARASIVRIRPRRRALLPRHLRRVYRQTIYPLSGTSLLHLYLVHRHSRHFRPLRHLRSIFLMHGVSGEHIEEAEVVAGDVGRIFKKYRRLPMLIFGPGKESSLPPF
jgi:hypothetical protein